MRLCASLLLLLSCLLPGLASARVEERSSLPSIHELPASTAHWPQESPILSGIEWTAISPPGTVLLPIEDEPYIQNQGGWHKGLPWIDQGLSSIRLVSHMPDGGFYNAVASLRMDPQKGDANRLRHSFDNAAHSMVRLAQVAREERTQLGYRVTEMRSPLGLADPRDKENCAREYIAYQAELVNPLARPRPEGEVLYSIVNGELRVLRIVDGRHYLLTVEFDSQDYPWAINTTCNIARLVLERFADCDEGMCIPGMLDYETEWYWPVVEEAQLAQADEAVADLLEQPDSGLHPGHFADRLAGEEEPALRSLPQRRHPSLPPGEVLTRLVRRMDPGVPCVAADGEDGIERVLAAARSEVVA